MVEPFLSLPIFGQNAVFTSLSYWTLSAIAGVGGVLATALATSAVLHLFDKIALISSAFSKFPLVIFVAIIYGALVAFPVGIQTHLITTTSPSDVADGWIFLWFMFWVALSVAPIFVYSAIEKARREYFFKVVELSAAMLFITMFSSLFFLPFSLFRLYPNANIDEIRAVSLMFPWVAFWGCIPTFLIHARLSPDTLENNEIRSGFIARYLSWRVKIIALIVYGASQVAFFA